MESKRAWSMAGRPRNAVVLLIVYWIAIFAATHTPSKRWPAEPGKTSDKVAHFTAFAGLTCLLGWTVSGRKRPTATKFQLLFLAAAAYGVLDELSQAPIEGRTPEVADWLADIFGAVSGLGLYNLTRVAAVGILPDRAGAAPPLAGEPSAGAADEQAVPSRGPQSGDLPRELSAESPAETSSEEAATDHASRFP